MSIFTAFTTVHCILSVYASDLSLIWGSMRESQMHDLVLHTDHPSQILYGSIGLFDKGPLWFNK